MESCVPLAVHLLSPLNGDLCICWIMLGQIPDVPHPKLCMAFDMLKNATRLRRIDSPSMQSASSEGESTLLPLGLPLLQIIRHFIVPSMQVQGCLPQAFLLLDFPDAAAFNLLSNRRIGEAVNIDRRLLERIYYFPSCHRYTMSCWGGLTWIAGTRHQAALKKPDHRASFVFPENVVKVGIPGLQLHSRQRLHVEVWSFDEVFERLPPGQLLLCFLRSNCCSSGDKQMQSRAFRDSIRGTGRILAEY